MSLVILVSCPCGQVNTQAAPGTLIRQHCWQGSGWPGSPGPALALGWPGTLEGSEGALGEHSALWRPCCVLTACGDSYLRTPLTPRTTPHFASRPHIALGRCVWMEQAPGMPWPLCRCRRLPGGLRTVLL